MHDSDGSQANTVDPVAKVIRAAGRRQAPPSEHYEQVFRAAREAWRRKLASRCRNRWLAVAASAAIVVAGGTILQMLATEDTVMAARITVAQGPVELRLDDTDLWENVSGNLGLAPGAHLRTRADSRAAIALARGGSLRLDVGTEIIVGVGRYELVSGTLYFDSDGRADSRPLEIATALGVVRDIGTQFEVATSQDLLRVRVRSGRVAITDLPVAVEIEGDAGTEIELSPDGNSIRRAFAPDDEAWTWVQALAVTPSSQSILSYLNWIARETGKRLEFASRYVERRAESELLIGDAQGHSPTQVLELISETSDFTYQLTDDGTILIERIDDP